MSETLLDEHDIYYMQKAREIAEAQLNAAWQLAARQQAEPTTDQVIAIAQVLATNFSAQVAKNYS